VSTERHEICENDVGAYLLSALSETEERRFEHHLEECHICRDEVERLRVAADALPRSVTPVLPPESLKRSLMAEVRADIDRPPVGKGAGQAGPVRSLLRRARRGIAGAGRGIGGMRPAVAWVSASFVLLVGILAGYAGTHILSEGDDTRTLSAAVDEARIPSGSGSLLVRDDGGQGAILRVHGMPTLERGRAYQVWVRRDGEVIPQSLFSVGRNGAGAAAVEGDLRDADAVMVTREAAYGARAPSEEPVLTVEL
jgi:Anti-sigma-K factor rskA/Putative zinc-finger